MTAGLASRLAAWRAEVLSDLAALTREDVLGEAQALAVAEETELLTRSLAAVSVAAQVAFRDARVEADLVAGLAPSRAGRTAADDLALARRTSPYWGSRDLATARALTEHLPHTMQALQTGTINGYQARIVAEVTACLSPEDRSLVDHRLHRQLEGASTKEIEAAARALVYEVDPAGYVDRARRAAKDRGVSIRPAPDVMATLSAHLPAAQAIACFKALRDHAKAAIASGDPRSRNQLMADELFHRLTGRHVVDGVDIELGIVMTDSSLFDGTSEPADLVGFGPIPADLARELLRSQARRDESARARGPGGGRATGADETSDRASSNRGARPAPELCPDGPACTTSSCTLLHGQPTEHTPAAPGAGPAPPAAGDEASEASGPSDTQASGPSDRQASGSTDLEAQAGLLRAARVWARRLYTDPASGVLTDLDPRRRLFTGAVRRLIISRDRYCRTPWCGAPIRDVDHKQRRRDGGPTTPDNGQGLCDRCNLTRERPTHLRREADLYLGAPPVLPTLPGRRRPPRRSSDAAEDDDEAA